jgi:hypothetical protein
VHGTSCGTDSVDAAPATPARDEHAAAIAQLVTARDPEAIEHLADGLTQINPDRWTDAARTALVDALVLCLTGESVQQDPDAEDAICSALANLGVMTRVGNLVFEFVPERQLAAGDAAVVRRYRGWLPSRYTPVGTDESGAST